MQDVADLSLHVALVPTPVESWCKTRTERYLPSGQNEALSSPWVRQQVNRETKTSPQLVGVVDGEELATSLSGRGDKYERTWSIPFDSICS